MARAPVQQLPLNAQLRPVATPVDTYVRPAQSPLRQLADALGTANKGLQTLIETRDKKGEEEQELKGRAAFYTDSQGEFAQAVSEGKIPAQYSPFYVKGFKQAQGAAAGDQLRTKWQDAWDNWEGKNSDDPKAFDTFFQTFLKDSLKTEDPDVLRGYLPAIEALQANARTQYTQFRHDATVTGEATTSAANILSGVQTGLDDGLVSEKGTDYEQIFKGINEGVTASLALGDPGGKKVDTFIDAMSAKILETRDVGLLKFFDQKVPGQDYTYGQTPHGIAVKNATLNNLETVANSQQAKLDAQQRKEQERLKDAATTAIIDSIIADPNAPFDDKMLTQAEKNGAPDIKVKAAGWRETLLKGGPSDPKAIQGFYSKVIAGEMSPKAALQQAMSNDVFRNPEDLRSAVTFIQSFQGQQDTIEKTLGGSTARNLLEAIRTRTVAKDQYNFNPVAGTTDEGFEAQSDFRELVTRWLIDNPNATPQEVEKQVNEFGKMVLERIVVPEGGDAMTAAQEYRRDPNLEFPNAFSGGGQKPQLSDVEQWEKQSGVTSEQRLQIERQAERTGMSYDEYVRSKVFKNAPATKPKPEGKGSMRAPDGTPIDPTSYDPNDKDLGEGDETTALTVEQASSFIDKVFSENAEKVLEGDILPPGSDIQTAGLAKLVRQAEAGGNYNAVYGRANSKYDLGQLTLDQVLGLQQEARRRGVKSTAIGAYQFLYKTLRGLKAETGLKGTEKFTPELQDKLFMALLNRRGLQAFRAGRISKRQFALSLSQEWAGLPNPNTGRSFYAGDGLNASRVKTASVYRALGMDI